jgi:asparagine synthase (glutamine-hydrolysing)
VTALHNRFEVVDEARATRKYMASAGAVSVGALKSLDLLQYNLRTVLHRNDALGMAASVESRFPFLDSEFVRVAVNMPERAKIRFSPLCFDERHYFFTDKWLLRRVAERYLPRQLSRRPKLGFEVNAAERLVIAPGFFDKSCLSEILGVSSDQMRFVVEQSRQPLKLRLLQLDVWASIFLGSHSTESVLSKLRQGVRVAAVGDAA